MSLYYLCYVLWATFFLFFGEKLFKLYLKHYFLVAVVLFIIGLTIQILLPDQFLVTYRAFLWLSIITLFIGTA